MGSLQEKFETKKPVIIAFVVGLIVGPLVSGIFGWQVRAKTVTDMVHDAVVTQQVRFCEARARAAVEAPDKLAYTERYNLAKEWAVMPWQNEADSEVVSGCSNNLSDSA